VAGPVSAARSSGLSGTPILPSEVPERVRRRGVARSVLMERTPPRGILDGVGPAGRPRRPAIGNFLTGIGALLVALTCAVIVIGPMTMPVATYTAIELALVLGGAAFGIFLAAHSRSTHVKIERAYSNHLEELSQRLRTMAYRDALTGLFNHRYFYEQLSHEIERSVRYGQPLTVLLMDMNNFKQINDTYGHMVGDRFLSLVGQVISGHIRSTDIGARYGGDEFVIILPNTGAAEARATAEKLAEAVSQAAAFTPNDEQVRLGISIGTATCPDDSRSPGELLEIADSRLYEVKAQRKQDARGARRSA